MEIAGGEEDNKARLEQCAKDNTDLCQTLMDLWFIGLYSHGNYPTDIGKRQWVSVFSVLYCNTQGIAQHTAYNAIQQLCNKFCFCES